MAWTAGPGELTSIQIGTETISADLIDAYSLTSEKDNYTGAIGYTVDRGSITKRLTFNNLDVSTIHNLHDFMTLRSEQSVTVTYQDGQTQVLDECIIRITPLLNTVTDVCEMWGAPAGSSSENLETGGVWINAGVTVDVPTFTYSFPFDGTDGCGRPFFSSTGIEVEVGVPKDIRVDNPSVWTEGSEIRVAFKLPDGNFQIYDGRPYFFYANEDASMPRRTTMMLRDIGAGWDIIKFTNGIATTEDSYNANGNAYLQDGVHGCYVEVVGFAYLESEIVTF